MENASKALLIAASVLIAILLIAFGMKIFTTSSKPVDNVEGAINSTEIATFNSKFLSYAGTNKTAAQVKSLANVIIASNSTNVNHKVKIKVLGNAETDSANYISNYVANLTGSFTIEISYGTNGYVENVTIS